MSGRSSHVECFPGWQIAVGLSAPCWSTSEFFLLRKRFPYIFSVDITWVKYIGVELTPRIDLSFRNRPVVFPGGRNDLHSHSPWAPFWWTRRVLLFGSHACGCLSSASSVVFTCIPLTSKVERLLTCLLATGILSAKYPFQPFVHSSCLYILFCVQPLFWAQV